MIVACRQGKHHQPRAAANNFDGIVAKMWNIRMYGYPDAREDGLYASPDDVHHRSRLVDIITGKADGIA